MPWSGWRPSRGRAHLRLFPGARSVLDRLPMATTPLPTLEFVLKNFKNFNARATRDALLSYWRHVEGGGRMFWAMAGAMSTPHQCVTHCPGP